MPARNGPFSVVILARVDPMGLVDMSEAFDTERKHRDEIGRVENRPLCRNFERIKATGEPGIADAWTLKRIHLRGDERLGIFRLCRVLHREQRRQRRA